MKLYTYPGAPSPMRVDLGIKLKGIELETQTIDLRAGGQFEPAYRAVNPRCTVPALELDDGKVLTDVIAIAIYLDRRFPEPPLFGTSDLETAEVFGWIHRVSMEGLMPAADVLRNSSEAFRNRALAGPDDIAQIPALADRGRLRLGFFFRMLDEHLSDRLFIVGDRLSQADIDAHVALYLAGWMKERPAESQQNLARWCARMADLLK